MPTVLRLTVERSDPLRRGQDHFWRIARTLGAEDRTFTAAAIAELSEEPYIGTITSWLRRLCQAGAIEKAGKATSPTTRRPETRWRLVYRQEQTPVVGRDGRLIRPRSARQQMWNVMRGPSGRGGFTYVDLVTLGSTDDLRIPANTAKSFIQEIKRAGYLLQLDPGGPGKPAAWRLRPAMNTGPLPPIVLTAKLVFDQNRKKVAGEVIAEEETS